MKRKSFCLAKYEKINSSGKGFIFLIFILFWITSCSSTNNHENSSSSNIEDNKIFIEEFGWKMNLSSQWRKLSYIESKLYDKIGDDAAKEEFKEKSINTWTELFKIASGSGTNQILATKGKYNPEYHGPDYEVNKAMRFDGIKKIYQNNVGIEVESVKNKILIDDTEFDGISMVIMQNGKKIMYQNVFEKKYENDQLLMISLMAQDKNKFQEFQDSLLNSTFSRKK